jgi:hypothetical protein
MRLIEAVENTTPHKPVDRGTYRGSWIVANEPNGVTIYNSVKYSSIIERGRRAGTKVPPVKLIADWVRRKGFVNVSSWSHKNAMRAIRSWRNPVTGKKVIPLRGSERSRKREQERAVLGVAFVIARNIAKKGIPGKWVLKRALDKIVPEILAAVHAAARAYSWK